MKTIFMAKTWDGEIALTSIITGCSQPASESDDAGVRASAGCDSFWICICPLSAGEKFFAHGSSIFLVNLIRFLIAMICHPAADINDFSHARLLIVDDEERNVRLLERVLEKDGFTCIQSCTDAREAVGLVQKFAPDIVLLDLRMPHKNGFELMDEIGALLEPHTFLPVIVLTADVTPGARREVLARGANDFLTKPFDAVEVLQRVRNLLRTRFLNQNLEEKIYERTRELEDAQFEVLQRLAQAGEFRDDDTGKHTQRVGALAAELAKASGWDEEPVRLMRQAAPLHDVGKIGISDLILLKPGKLTSEEFAVMKQHTVIGANILANGRSALMQMAERIALTHHERWDGVGYPHGLAGEAIPIEGRMLAIVDVFDALTHDRPYKSAWTIGEALAEIEKQSGTQFDPQLVRAFMTLPLEAIMQSMA
jgi:putative two-component system response regulator